jgi:hypothetical protein
VWRKREAPAELETLLKALDGLGSILMSIDARLAEVVELLREDDDED